MDREVGERDLTLVLCGSEVGTMERLQSGDSPLYGRLDWSARIVPFDYRDAARMVPGRPARERAYIYGVFGGRPRFLAVIDPDDAFDERVRRTVLSPRGERARLTERLLASLDEDAEVEEAWAAEVRRRLDAYRKGDIEAVPVEDVVREARRRVTDGG